MWMGGPVPHGYDNIEKKLVVNKPEAETVNFIFSEYLKVRSVDALRERFKAMGMHTKNAPEGRQRPTIWLFCPFLCTE